MKRGFTLVELLGVVVILSVIMAFAFPVILNTIKDKNKKSEEYQMEMIKNAARLYIRDNGIEKSNDKCIPISELEESKYLNKLNIKEKGIKITYSTDGEEYILVDSCN